MANLGLVGMVVKRFNEEGIARIGGQDDAFQWGVFGLIRAAELWEPEKAKFSTYATWAIISHIKKALAFEGIIRLKTGGIRGGDKLRQAAQLAQAIQQFPVNEDGEFFEAFGYEEPEPFRDDEKEMVRRAVAKLGERDAAIVWARVNGEKLETIGRRLGVSKERVRQLWVNAKRRLGKVLPCV